MRPEDRLLFACARQNFSDTYRQNVLDICRCEEIDWHVVCSTARLHGVAPLIYSNLLQCIPLDLSIPQDILDRFKICRYRNIVRKEQRAERLTQALAYFDRKSIDVMLIKGVALDILVYNQPWYTVPHDVDLVLRPRGEEIPDETKIETMTFLHGSGIEFDYFAHHDVVINGALPIDFQRIWGDASRTKVGGQDVFLMSPEDMLMSVCINSCRKRFFRLKSLCDVAEVINRYPDIKWEELTTRAKAYDCNSIIYTALLVTKMTVGCKLPPGLFNDLEVNPIRAGVIDRLVRHLSQHSSLDSLYPFSGTQVFGREVNLAVMLPYATYRGYQVGRKLKEIYCAWRGEG